MLFIILILVVLVIVFFMSAFFNEHNVSKGEKIFTEIVLAILFIAFCISGMAGIGEGLPVVLTPFLLFFTVCIYMAKEDRATARILLKQVNEKLEKTEKELEEIKLLLKKENNDEQNSEEDTESDEENQE